MRLKNIDQIAHERWLREIGRGRPPQPELNTANNLPNAIEELADSLNYTSWLIAQEQIKGQDIRDVRLLVASMESARSAFNCLTMYMDEYPDLADEFTGEFAYMVRDEK